MLRLILKDFFKQKKVLLLILFAIFCSLIFSLNAKMKNNSATEKEISQNENAIEIFRSDILDIETKIEELKLRDKEGIEEKKENTVGEENQEESEVEYREKSEEDYTLEDYELALSDSKSIIERYEDNIKWIKESNWDKIYERNLKKLKDEKGEFGLTGIDDYRLSPKTVEITYNITKYLKANKLPSAFPDTIYKNAFENPVSNIDKKTVDKYGDKTLLGTYNRLWDFMFSNVIWVFIIVILLSSGLILTRLESENIKAIRFISASGVSKKTAIFKTFGIGAFLTLLFSSAILLSIGFVEFLVNGMSSLKYPILYYFKSEKIGEFADQYDYKILPLEELLIKAIVLLLLFGIVVYLVSTIYALLTKSSIKTFILSLGTIGILQMYPKFYNPFFYFKTGRIVDGSYNVMNRTFAFTFINGVIVLCVSILILVIIFSMLNYVMNKNINLGRK